MDKPVDLELKKAFNKLHVKMNETSKKIHIIDSQISVASHILNLIDVTRQMINSLPPKTNIYESVGRMFLMTDAEDVKTNLMTREAQLTKRTSELEKNKLYLQNNLKESEDNIREMVRQRKTKTN